MSCLAHSDEASMAIIETRAIYADAHNEAEAFDIFIEHGVDYEVVRDALGRHTADAYNTHIYVTLK